jgi:hypothetical protein
MLAVAGAAVFAPVLRPTVDAVAGAVVFAPPLRLTVLAEVFCAVYFTAPRPWPQQHLVFPFIWIFLSALNMTTGVYAYTAFANTPRAGLRASSEPGVAVRQLLRKGGGGQRCATRAAMAVLV